MATKNFIIKQSKWDEDDVDKYLKHKQAIYVVAKYMNDVEGTLSVVMIYKNKSKPSAVHKKFPMADSVYKVSNLVGALREHRDPDCNFIEDGIPPAAYNKSVYDVRSPSEKSKREFYSLLNLITEQLKSPREYNEQP